MTDIKANATFFGAKVCRKYENNGRPMVAPANQTAIYAIVGADIARPNI